ncbi:protein kinase [alpha proteobacterium U9-1i]|nr:protein kinase [alpha proteobacterium U9-1i]
MAELFRYAAFISYSSKDAKFAQRLHRALESYGIPSSLGKFDLIGGGKQNRIYPVFRDREELSAGHLGDQIEANLKASAALIVVCSPNGAASPWVQKEIEFFATQGRHAKIFAIIPDTAPLTDEHGADCTQACFPPAFRGDALAGDTLEPLAADARKGKDGFRNAWLKIVAGMVGVSPGQIIDRDKKRRAQQRVALGVGGVVAVTAIALAGATVAAWDARKDFTARAAVLTQNRPLDAIAFALAGLPAPGDALNLTNPSANAALEQTNAVGLIADLGPLDRDAVISFGFSGDSHYLLTRDADRTGALRDLRDLAVAPHSLGPLRHDSSHLFSDDGRFLVTRAPDDGGVLHDLNDLDADPRPLGQIAGFAFSSDGRFLATADFDGSGRYGSGRLLDLRDPDIAPRTLGRLSYLRAFSGDGRFFLVRGEDEPSTLLDLRDPSAPSRPVGRLTDHAFSSDGRFLLTRESTGVGTLYDLHDPAVATRPLGQLFEAGGFGFSNDGRFLMTRDPNVIAVVRDLHNPGATPRPLELFSLFQFSGDGRFLLTLNERGVGVLRDLHDAGVAPRPLGQVTGFAFSGDGRFLMTHYGATSTSGSGLLHDLSNANAVPLPLGGISDLDFSSDGRFLLTINEASVGTLRDLNQPGSAQRTLGLLRNFGFSRDGRFLLTQDFEGGGVLRDLAVLPDGDEPLRSSFCQVSGDAVRPFHQSVRADRADSLYPRLRGRPWNPCDWRGVFAIFPNAEQGDGWFEGARQWLRLMQVRYFGGADYSCEEATSASVKTRARRRDMCERFANQETPAPT